MIPNIIEGFYCADYDRVGTTCEEQCPACKKTNNLESGDDNPVPEKHDDTRKQIFKGLQSAFCQMGSVEFDDFCKDLVNTINNYPKQSTPFIEQKWDRTTLQGLILRIKQRAYLDNDEEIARWIKEWALAESKQLTSPITVDDMVNFTKWWNNQKIGNSTRNNVNKTDVEYYFKINSNDR